MAHGTCSWGRSAKRHEYVVAAEELSPWAAMARTIAFVAGGLDRSVAGTLRLRPGVGRVPVLAGRRCQKQAGYGAPKR